MLSVYMFTDFGRARLILVGGVLLFPSSIYEVRYFYVMYFLDLAYQKKKLTEFPPKTVPSILQLLRNTLRRSTKNT